MDKILCVKRHLFANPVTFDADLLIVLKALLTVPEGIHPSVTICSSIANLLANRGEFIGLKNTSKYL